MIFLLENTEDFQSYRNVEKYKYIFCHQKRSKHHCKIFIIHRHFSNFQNTELLQYRK